MAVLDWSSVEEIRMRWEGGETQSSLCVEYGVSLNTISKIVKGQSWVRKPPVARVARRSVEERPEDIMARMLALQARVDIERASPPISPLEEI